MTKICLLGNSHLAALKRAWDTRTDEPVYEPTFFGSSAYSIASLRRHNGFLFSLDEKVRQTFNLTAGTDRIHVAAFDVFVLVGICLEFRDFLSIFRTHVLMSHRKMRTKRPILSAAAFKHTLDDLYARVPAPRLVSLIRELSDKPVICVASPCPSATITSKRKFSKYASTIEDPLIGALYQTYLTTATDLAKEKGWTFVPQVESTLRVPGLSQERYSVNSVSVGWTKDTCGPDRRGDEWHMNADYGRILLDRLIGILPSMTKAITRIEA